MVNGAKIWCTNADIADFILVAARTQGPQGEPLGINLFIVDKGTPGLTVGRTLQAHGFPKSRIKIELFAASIPKHEHKAQAVPEPGHADCAVTAILDGATRQFTLEKTKENIIDAAIRQGIELPYSCKGGVCSTCRAKLIEGEVDMDVNFALEDYEVARGFILCCQSYPVTDKVVVDFDQGA